MHVCVCVCVLGMKKFEYMGKQWHEQCFCCQECRQPISAKSFIPRDQHVICITCYESQYAQRCAKCNSVSCRRLGFSGFFSRFFTRPAHNLSKRMNIASDSLKQ